ncbi:hypothetical protein N7478_012571 [Penicillium angulare]|uniref:uncharacterized protein n=1 Tax=Penicillium angulare TaxID=116970 RepID=UPI002540EE31|nr:uncharacterized protein N7478_012571 [Penicillium angulare]KAJ5259590.1 hypothetical protein N7478_012571 [Penicillium angulare]
MLRLEWLVVTLSALGTWGASLPGDVRCVTALYSAYNYITFAGLPAKGMFDTRCQNPLKVTSIYAASEIYCRDTERVAGLAQMAAECEEFGHHQLLPREAVAGNLTEDAIRGMRIVKYAELTRSDVMNAPVMISASYFNRVYNTIEALQFETWSHHAFGFVGYAYWGFFIVLAIGYRLCGWATYQRRDHNTGAGEIESQIYNPTGSWHTGLPLIRDTLGWLQTHLLVAPPFTSRGREVLLCIFSNRAEALAVSGFWIISITLSFVGYRTFEGNIYWPDIPSQILRYSADRTGIMSFANIPLLWLFGGRNNILIWATGWSFATFNVFHRHVARVATLQAVAHTILYLIIYYRTGKLWRAFNKTYIVWGLLGVLVMVFLLLTSLDRIRSGTYEIFLIVHVLLSILTLVGCFYIFRLNKIRATSARMTYDEATDVVRLEVLPATPFLSPSPGDYFFLYQPFRWTGWESHPFTVGAWSSQVESATGSSRTGKATDALDLSQQPLLSNAINQPDEPLPAEECEKECEVSNLKAIFWIRPYNGWTQHLRQQCLRSKVQPVETTILLEGPYGHHFPIWNYESVLMIMGGTGIASAVPYLQEHIRRSKNEWGESSKEKTYTRDIELVWTARQIGFLNEVANRELQPLLARQDFQATFYATRAFTCSPDDLNESACDIKLGRPHLQSLIMSRASDASSAGVSLVILVCGPAGMADEARAATHLAMRQGHSSIKYVEESFAW